MGHHVELARIDALFAGAVEVELQQVITASTNDDAVAGLQVDLNGVAVVDHAELGGPVVKLDGLQLDLDAIADVDGALPLAEAAQAVFWFERAPLVWAAFASVVPVGAFTVGVAMLAGGWLGGHAMGSSAVCSGWWCMCAHGFCWGLLGGHAHHGRHFLPGTYLGNGLVEQFTQG